MDSGKIAAGKRGCFISEGLRFNLAFAIIGRLQYWNQNDQMTESLASIGKWGFCMKPDWAGRWIGEPDGDSLSTYAFRCSDMNLTLSIGEKSKSVHLGGLGQIRTLRLNGNKVSDHVLMLGGQTLTIPAYTTSTM